jgi:2'-5' RNA ligase
VWPPAPLVAGFERPERLHVTLRFLGEVADPASVVLPSSLPPAVATVGTSVRRLGRDAVVVPVAGLDELAAAVVAATAGVGRPPDHRRFTGHLTLARSKGPVPAVELGPLAGASWPVAEVTLVRSALGGRSGARYEVLERTPVRV